MLAEYILKISRHLSLKIKEYSWLYKQNHVFILAIETFLKVTIESYNNKSLS